MNIAMNIGEAAGVAASLCLDCNMTNKELEYKKVQEVLIGRGIELFKGYMAYNGEKNRY